MNDNLAFTSPATVLVVDDEVAVRFAIADYLRECGYRVIEAASGEEAKIILGAPEHKLDVLLCDAGLSGSPNAFEIVKVAKQIRPETVIILAGSADMAADAAAKLCDRGPNLARPYDPQLVSDRIKRMLAGRSGPSPLITSNNGLSPSKFDRTQAV